MYERKWEYIPTHFPDLPSIQSFFERFTRNRQSLRNVGSAVVSLLTRHVSDYFVFSRDALPLITRTEEEAVVGRYGIDNYVMGAVWDRNRRNQTSQLIDSTFVGE